MPESGSSHDGKLRLRFCKARSLAVSVNEIHPAQPRTGQIGCRQAGVPQPCTDEKGAAQIRLFEIRACQICAAHADEPQRPPAEILATQIGRIKVRAASALPSGTHVERVVLKESREFFRRQGP